MAANNVQRIIKILQDADNTIDNQITALTNFRRSHMDGHKIKTLKDEEFCELCNSVIEASVADEERLHIEACHTLEVILQDTRNRNFDFFQSILQINRKKRLKILYILSILKDQTLASIANKMSVLDFLKDCLESVNPNNMSWLLPENAENENSLKCAECQKLNEKHQFEEKVVDGALQLLLRIYDLTNLGLNIRQFDTFIMDKVVTLAYMGHKRQRKQALNVLQLAAKNDLGLRVRSINKDVWDKFKENLQKVYCKRMTILVHACDQDWAVQWETSIHLVGTDLHRGSGLVNSLLKVEEFAFKSADQNRRQAFISWKQLIDNFALDQRELATGRRIKLLCVPLNAKNSKTESLVLIKLEVWWHLICKIYPSLAECLDTILLPFLNICFGPFGDKPLFVQKSDSNISIGKKYLKTQIFCIHAFMQLIVKEEEQTNLSNLTSQMKIPHPVNNMIFEKLYKVLIHSFGEIVFLLAQAPEEFLKNRLDVCKIIWENLIKRIEEYDKMKVDMYKEVTIVIDELFKKISPLYPMLNKFIFHIVLNNPDNIVNKMYFTETVLMDLVQSVLKVDNFSEFTNDNYHSIESLLDHVIKPKMNADIYNPKSMELIQSVLKTLDEAKKENTNLLAICKLWCVLASVAKRYIEGIQNINEGSLMNHKFQTSESIVAFPFKLSIENHEMLEPMSAIWREFYIQFDFQAELVVTVKQNEILNNTCNMIIDALNNNPMCCNFGAYCIEGLIAAVNYENLLKEKNIPPLINLMHKLTFTCLLKDSFATEKVLKALSAFLLKIFIHNADKTALYLKSIEPAVKFMLTKEVEYSLENAIANTWTTIVSLFKKLKNNLNYELLECYKKSISNAMMHLNEEISHAAFSIVDLKDGMDEKSKKLVEEIINDLQISSLKSSSVEEVKTKIKPKNKIGTEGTKNIGSFLNRKPMSPASTKLSSGLRNTPKAKPIEPEPDSQDFVVINTDHKIDVSCLTEHQKEKLKMRRDDIPALYNDLTTSNSQDSQELQRWFDAKTGKSSNLQPNKTTNSNDSKQVFLPPLPTLNWKNHSKNTQNEQQKTLDDGSNRSSSSNNTEEQKSSPQKSPAGQKLVKKLDFESTEEFPANNAINNSSAVGTDVNVNINLPFQEKLNTDSPENVNKKMKKRNSVEEKNGDERDNSLEKAKSMTSRIGTRRSLQPQLQQINLRRSNSSEQLSNKRGRKRRNSDSNSEGMLGIEREKRPKLPNTIDEVLNSSGESIQSNDSNNQISSQPEADSKKLSKRQINEMSRLKIDMRFSSALPGRRSIGKNEKPTGTSAKKSKEEKLSIVTKTDNTPNTLQQNVTTRRRSFKQSGRVTPEVNEKKENTKSSLDIEIKSTARKSITSKPFSDEQVINEDVNGEDIFKNLDGSTNNEESTMQKSSSSLSQEESQDEEIKSTQDSDIVECSQQNSKSDKVDCFIKVKKIEVDKQTEEEPTKMNEIIEETPMDNDEISIIPSTLDTEKLPQPETKKVENKTAVQNHTASPKSNSRLSNVVRHKRPLQNRAAHMLGLVTKQSLAEGDGGINEEISIIPLGKKETKSRENDRVASPNNSGSRQEKMFNNMNRQPVERSCSPAINMFCNLRNNGERISPKLDKNLQEKDVDSSSIVTENGSADESPNGKSKKELPMLEWSNANPPSLTASPSASILKRLQEADIETPNRKKRVSFADPPVSREMGYEIMTETSSPPRLEKLPSLRSPISRHDSRRQSRLRMYQSNIDKLESQADNDARGLNNADKAIPGSPKIKLSTVLNSLPAEDFVAAPPTPVPTSEPPTPPTDQTSITSTGSTTVIASTSTEALSSSQDGDIFNEHNDAIKTLTSQEAIDTSIMLNSINLNKSASSLEDTVNVDNMSSSMETSHNTSDKVSRSFSQDCGEQGDTLPVTDSVFSNPLSQESQNSVAQLNEPENLDSTLPVFPTLTSCTDGIDVVSKDLVDPLLKDNLVEHLTVKSIRSIGDLAQLSEREINRLPIRNRPTKIDCIKTVLSRYAQRISKSADTNPVGVSSSTPLRHKTRSLFEDLMKPNVSAVLECKKPQKRQSTDSSIQTSPVKKKKNDEAAYKEMMDNFDDEFLFEAFVNRFEYERILKGYREKMSEKTEKQLKKETLNILGLSEEDDSEASFKASSKTVGLHKVLQQLPSIFESDETFIDTVLKTYKKMLKPAVVMNFFKENELKEVIRDRYSVEEHSKIIIDKLYKNKSNESELKTLLDVISPETIVSSSNQTKRHAIFKALANNMKNCELLSLFKDAMEQKLQGT